MAARELRIVVDHMLLKLGRYLRCLGIDAVWDLEHTTHELMRRAHAERRTFVTRNARPQLRRRVALRVLLVRSTDPVEQVREVLEATGVDPMSRIFSRCIRCNVELEELPPAAPALDRLPPRVRSTYRRFHRCPSCETVFWKGTHVANTCRKLGLPDASEIGAG